MDLIYPPTVSNHFSLRPTLLSALDLMLSKMKGAADPITCIAPVLGSMTAEDAGNQATILHIILVAANDMEALHRGDRLQLAEALRAADERQGRALLARARLLVLNMRPGGCDA